MFVSHSSKDKKYGEALVQFMLDIGIMQNNIIFTSKQGYGVPKGENIFHWLKTRLQEKPFVIYLLSDNYYLSIPCLNEMGAAWVVENDHISLFTPGFEPSDDRFSEGAIDPRKLGVFINNVEDMIAFAEIIINKNELNISHIILNQAIAKFTRDVNAIISNETNEKFASVNKDFKDNFNNSNIDNLEANDINTKKEVVDLVDTTQPVQITESNFLDDILKGKLTEEELLLVKYMSDTGVITLGDRWMAEETKENIKQWQEINQLDNKLFRNYDKVLNKFIIRKYVTVKSRTSYGNPREYELIDEVSKHILNFSEDILKKLEEILNSNSYSDGLPF